MATSIDQSQLM